jgi:hypothetical protein
MISGGYWDKNEWIMEDPRRRWKQLTVVDQVMSTKWTWAHQTYFVSLRQSPGLSNFRMA